MENYTAPERPNVVIENSEAAHREKATTAMILAIVGLALLILPGLNLIGFVLSIIGLSMAVKNRKLAAANGFKECSNNNTAFICGLIGVIVNGLFILLAILGIILVLALTATAVSLGAPTISEIITETAPVIGDVIESTLPTVESTITGFFGLL